MRTGGGGAAWRLLAAAGLVALGARPAAGQKPAAAEPWILRAGALTGVLHVDGVLDEPAWQDAPQTDALLAIEPKEGAPPSGRTIVRVLEGPKALVFGIRCEDPDAGRIVSFTKERDGELANEDHVAVVLDPFRDGLSGYLFAVNPGGARYDALVTSAGEKLNPSWDGIWEARTSRDPQGWTAEIRIPIDTLSFASGRGDWGFNVQRRIQRLQETIRWASPNRDYEVTQTSRAGVLAGLPRFDLGWGLSVRPSFVTGFDNPAPGARNDFVAEPSLDVTKRLGSNLLASLTVNTDFAETEVDTRQTNLTRFPLFFPEKRTFFLEAADVFEFGLGTGTDVLPYFSRRIGLVEGAEAPILGGLKVSGRAGRTAIGGLVARTGEVAGIAPASTMGVLRVRQSVLEESSAGFIGTVGDPLGRPGSFTAGADLTYQTSRFRGDKNFLAGVWGLGMNRDGLAGDKTAFGLKVDYPNDLFDCALLARRVGDAFDPSLGFVPRPGVYAYTGGCSINPRPGNFIRQMFFEFYPELFTDLQGRWESYRLFMAPVNWRLESGDRFELNVVPVGERLVAPFEIADGVVAPAGSYDWRRYRAEVETASKRKLAGQLTWWFGGFYGGTLDQYEVEGAWTPSPVITFLVNGERNVGHLPTGNFDETLVGLKVRLNLSPDLQLNSFIQYDTESRTLGTNTRLRWTFRPRGELFVVYNHNLRDVLDRFARDSNELLVKVQYAFRR